MEHGDYDLILPIFIIRLRVRMKALPVNISLDTQ